MITMRVPCKNTTWVLNGRKSFCTTSTNFKMRLPVLEKVASLFPSNYMSKVNLSAVIHTLPSMVPVFDTMINRLGLDPDNTLGSGKYNSECIAAREQLKSLKIHYLDNFLHPYKNVGIKQWYDLEYSIIKRNNFPLIRFKHGNIADIKYELKLQEGNGLLSGKRKIIEGESTASGEVNINESPFPVLSYAKCAIKKVLEARLIAEQLFKRFSEEYPEVYKERLNIGIIGYGAVGKEWAKKLGSLGHKIVIYDSALCDNKEDKESRLNFCYSPEELVQASNFIFNCSPSDLTAEPISYNLRYNLNLKLGKCLAEALLLTTRDIKLFSCSSDQVAYYKLIQLIYGKLWLPLDPLQMISVQNNFGGKITIYNGGYPFNFTRTGDASDPQDIQLTRAMLLSSILLQKWLLDLNVSLDSLPKNIMLDPYMQRFIVQQWAKLHPNPYRLYSRSLLKEFDNIQWITENSGGTYYKLPCIEKIIQKFEA